MNVRENWRVMALVVLVLASTFALFGPVGDDDATGAAVSQGPTNLEYGLELGGGTRIRAPLVGMTAEDVQFDESRESQISRTIASELGISQADVSTTIGPDRTGTVEVYSDDVTRAEIAAAIRAANAQVAEEDVRDGVTRETRQRAIRILNDKINRGGLAGGQATISSSGGQHYVVIEVPNANRSQVLDLVGDRGVVEVVAHFPDEDEEDGYRDVTLLTQEDLAEKGTAQSNERTGQPYVPITLRTEAAENFSNAMRTFGYTSHVGECRYFEDPEDSGYCLYTELDDRVVYAAPIGPRLASSIEDGTWSQDPVILLETSNMSEARALAINLNAGALPTELAIDSGTVTEVSPSTARERIPLSALTGLAAWIAVSGVVFLRYKSPRVAIPMLLTAMAEVYLLLGFAAAVGLALELSHIAGFIAVIGTGVDDLVIIADEILGEDGVATGKVFQNRFRKAFWVIGAAAATTIVAMSPLVRLSLGDLTGFAIVTIVGVLLGVLVTRPAYGDVLRTVMIDEDRSED